METRDVTATVVRIHDDMAAEYDDMDSPWYAWLFSEMCRFVADTVEGHTGQALDVGCGTGIHSWLLARGGFTVTGIDLSEKLLRKAREKNAYGAYHEGPYRLFQSDAPYAIRASQQLEERLARMRKGRPIEPPSWAAKDALTADFPEGSFDVVVCLGSVLSLVENPDLLLKKLVGWVKPGGYLIVEVEQRWNGDAVWALADGCLEGRLGYGGNLREALKIWRWPWHQRVTTSYPFEMRSGEVVHMPLHLWSRRGFLKKIENFGVRLIREKSVHAVTNVLPSVWLHGREGGVVRDRVFEVLRRLDTVVAEWPIVRGLGCSYLAAFQKN